MARFAKRKLGLDSERAIGVNQLQAALGHSELDDKDTAKVRELLDNRADSRPI